MKVPFGDLKRQAAALEAELGRVLNRAVASGWYILGPETAAFEQAFADYLGAGRAIGVANGTEAISLALMGLGIGPGDEVVVPANTCVPSLTGLNIAGARAVAVDCRMDDYNLDPAAVARALDEDEQGRIKAVLAVHLYGLAADLAALDDLCRDRGVALIEDCAQAHGAEFNGAKTGTFGPTAAFSFYPTKNLGALGDGGLVIARDEETAERIKRLRNYGYQPRDLSLEVGLNSRLDEIQAAILAVKLTYLDRWNRRRRELAAIYDRLLDRTKVVVPTVPEGRKHAYHLYVIRTGDRDRLQEELASVGVGTAIHYPVPMHRQPGFKGRVRTVGDLAAAERLCRTVLSLPMFPELTDDEAVCVAEQVNRLARPLTE